MSEILDKKYHVSMGNPCVVAVYYKVPNM